MKKLLNITCKNATYLISIKEEGKLGFIDKMKLKMHLGICSACRIFAKQSWFIKLNANYNHEHLDVTLSDTAKEKMDIALRGIK
jgi:hypothetical protein